MNFNKFFGLSILLLLVLTLSTNLVFADVQGDDDTSSVLSVGLGIRNGHTLFQSSTQAVGAKITFGSDTTINNVTFNGFGSGVGTTNLRISIYGDNSGQPNASAIYYNESNISLTTTACSSGGTDYIYNFSGQNVEAGDYWIVLSSSQTGTPQFQSCEGITNWDVSGYDADGSTVWTNFSGESLALSVDYSNVTLESLSFDSPPTPVNDSSQYAPNSQNVTVNTTAVGFGDYVVTNQYLWNSLGLYDSNSGGVWETYQKGEYDGTRQNGQANSFFNATLDEKVTIGNEFSDLGTNSYTIVTWINNYGFDTSDATGILWKTSDWGLRLEKATSKPRFFVYNSTGTALTVAISGEALSANETHQLVITFNGTNGYLYIDGGLNASGTFDNSQGFASTTNDLALGSQDTSRDFYGYIYRVSIYNNTIWSASDVSNDFAIGAYNVTNSSNGLVLQYLLNRSESLYSNSSTVFNVYSAYNYSKLSSSFLGLPVNTYYLNASTRGVEQTNVYDGERQGGQSGTNFNNNSMNYINISYTFDNNTFLNYTLQNTFSIHGDQISGSGIFYIIDSLETANPALGMLSQGSNTITCQAALRNSSGTPITIGTPSYAINYDTIYNITCVYIWTGTTYNILMYDQDLLVRNLTDTRILVSWQNPSGYDRIFLGAGKLGVADRYMNMSLYNSKFRNTSLSYDQILNELSLGSDVVTNLSDGLVLQYLLNKSSSPYNSTYANSSHVFNVNSSIVYSSQLTFHIYNLSNANITSPANNTNWSNRYINVTWSNASVLPSGSGVTITNFSLFLYNSSFGLLKGLVNTTQLNFTNWDVYSESLDTGIYYLLLNATDNNTNTVNSDYYQYNLTRNTRINITAIASNGTTINNFDGWIYNTEEELNLTYSTTTGAAFIEQVKGNLTILINATNYSLDTEYVVAGLNATNAQHDYQFTLYETNTLNITFYDEANPTTVLNWENVSLDLISDTYANNYSTGNGTLYITLLTPETYTLRYTAPSYTERFYTVTVTNRTFQSLNLYLINNSLSYNLTAIVIDEITDPVENASVKALKYYLPNNTYLLQEICTTNNEGKCTLSVTVADEFYKFFIELNGETKLITVPAYITPAEITSGKTFQIETASTVGQEFFDYYNFYHDLTFNTATDSFRLDWNDASGVSTQVCLEQYLVTNFSETLQNTSCATTATGTILLSVTPTNGTTYKALAYYVLSGEETFLDSKLYTYPPSNVFGSYGLYLQLLLTTSALFLGFLSVSFAAIIAPFTLILGYFIGLNQFTLAGLIPLQVVGLIVGIFLSAKKTR